MGFSALVEVKINGVWKKILFDTGAEPETVAENIDRLANLQKMKDAQGNPLTVCDADTVILSHNHQGHTMGLVELRQRCKKINYNALATAYVGGPEIFWSGPYNGTSTIGRTDDNVMVPGNGIAQALGLNPKYDKYGIKSLYESSGGTFVVPDGSQPVALDGLPGVWITSHIPRVYDEKTYPGTPNVVDPADWSGAVGQSARGSSARDQYQQGLVVITGCAHSGVVNTALYAQKMLGQTLPIYALLGGYHLFQMRIGDANTPGTLAWTAQQLAGNGLGIHIFWGLTAPALRPLRFCARLWGLI